MLNISSDVIRGYNDTIILYLLLDTSIVIQDSIPAILDKCKS